MNNLTIGRNGSTIEGLAQDLILDISQNTVEFVYDGTTWQVYSGIGPSGAQGLQGSSGLQGLQGLQGPSGAGSAISITNDTSTNSTFYPSFVNSTSGTVAGINVSSTKLFFNPSTGVLSATTFNSLSDVNLKENINNLVDVYETIDKFSGKSFVWKDSKQKAYGFIAQEVEEILPDLVLTENGFKTVNYDAVIPFLVEYVKLLREEIKILKT